MSASSRVSIPDISRETALVVGLISGSQFVNHMYLVLFPPILGILSESFTVTLAALGIALGVQGATNTAFQLPFGYLADTYDRTLALALSSVLGSAGVLLVALAPSFEWLLVGQAVIGIGVAGHHPAHYPLISDATPEDLRGRAYSVYGFGGSMGFAAAPAFITLAIGLPGWDWRRALTVIALFGFAYAVVLIAVFLWRVSDDVTAPNVDAAADSEQGDHTIVHRIRAQLRALAASPGILALALLALVTSTASWGFTSFAVVFLTDGYGVGLNTANLTLTGVFVVGALAILIGGDLTDRIAPGPVMVVSYTLLTVFLVLVALEIVPAAVAIGCMLLIGIVRSLANPARSKLTDDLSDQGTTGRNFAVITIGIMLGSAIAPPVFGALIEQYSLGTTFLGIAAVALLAVIVSGWTAVAYTERGLSLAWQS